AGTRPRAPRGPTATRARRDSRVVVPVPPQRRVLPEPLHLGGHVRPLPLEMVRHGGAQADVVDPVHARRLGRVEAPELLELPARPGLEALEPLRDAVRDARVVADVEVEVAQVLEGAPVAAVQRAGLLEVESAGDDLPALPGHDEAQIGPESLRHEL